jgi:DDE superfamily endonuclease
MEDVLSVYARPYDDKKPVVCLDEARKELRSTPRGSLPAKEGRTSRQDYEYERHGTASFFLWIEPLAGRRQVHVTQRQTGHEFAEVLRQLVEEAYPDAEKVVLVTDNLNTHKPDCLYNRFPPEQAFAIMQKLEWHYTPEHGSWLNIAECELSVLARQCLARRIADREVLSSEIAAWQEHRNARAAVINWQFTTTDARTKLKRLYPVFKEQETTG